MFLKTNKKVAVHIQDNKIFLAVANFQENLIKIECLQELSLNKEELTGFVKKKGLKRLPVYLVLEGKEIMARIITLPSIPLEEISQVLQWELTKYIPFSPEDIIFDYEIIDSKKVQKSSREISLLVIAAPRTYIEKYCDLLFTAGLKPAVVEVEGNILKYLYLNSTNRKVEESSCFIYLEKERAVLSFLSYERILFIYNIEGREIVHKVSTEYMRINRYLERQFHLSEEKSIYVTGKVDDLTLKYLAGNLDVSVHLAQIQSEFLKFPHDILEKKSSYLFPLGLLLRGWSNGDKSTSS